MQTAAFKAALGEATSETRKFAAGMRAEMAEAKGSIALLGEEIGVAMPRHLRTFVAGLPGVASAMSAAFDAVAVIALADFVYKAGEKVVEFFKKSEDGARKTAAANGEFTASLVKSNDQLAVGNDKLEIEIAKLSHKPTNNLKLALDEAKLSAIDLADKLDKATTKERELLDSENAGWFARLTGTASNDSAKEGLNQYQKNYQQINQQFDEYLQSAKSVGEEQDLEIQRRQALSGLTNSYYDSLTKEIKLRKEYQGIRDSGGDLNTDEVRQFEAKYGGGDQNKVLPSLQTLQGQIGVGATGLGLEVHHDQLVNEDAALQAKKQATEESSKADQQLLKSIESTFQQKKMLQGLDAIQEAAYWGQYLHTFRANTSEAMNVAEKYKAALGAMTRETGALSASFKKALEIQNDPGLKPESTDAYDKAVAAGKLQQASLQASLTETKAKMDLSTGAINANAAALLLQSAHVGEYQAKFAALNKELADLQAETIPGAFDPQNAAKQQGVQNQIADLSGKAQIQALIDSQAVLSTTWTGMVDGVFDELIKKSQDTQSQLKGIATSTVESLNTEMAKSLTGQKTDYSKVFLHASQSLAKSGLEKAEGFGLQALGLGKRDGSTAANALYVQMTGGAGGGGMPNLASIFGSSKANVTGPGGDSAVANMAGKGLLGWLNNSNWASSLDGGRLFGAGSIFGHFASGGDVAGGLPIDVGEMGREKFVPSVPGRIVPNKDIGGTPTIGYIDARGTDPALTRANLQRALAMTRAQAVHDASHIMAERNQRTPH
jgi:hypothetical protein